MTIISLNRLKLVIAWLSVSSSDRETAALTLKQVTFLDCLGYYVDGGPGCGRQVVVARVRASGGHAARGGGDLIVALSPLV